MESELRNWQISEMGPGGAATAPESVSSDVARALAEDMADGDRTASLIPEEIQLEARVISRENAVLAGRPWFDETFRQLNSKIDISWQASDGDVILNFLQTLSGTASCARQFVDTVEGTGAIILDTRKTLPGLRLAQKYAVRCGGASNHRIGLFDAILIKENHISAAGSISTAVSRGRRDYPELLLEVEVENMGQLAEAVTAGAQRALLDNFALDTLREAVRHYKGKIQLEASGGINLDTVRAVAESGVDFISTGDITKSVRATDFSMRFI